MGALRVSKDKVTESVRVGESGADFETPGKERPRKKLIRDVDKSVKQQIRDLIYEFAGKRLSPSLAIVLAAIRVRGIPFTGGRFTLSKVLHDLGFVYRRRDGTRWLQEQPHIVLKRIQFLKKMKNLIDEGKQIIYQDETWTFRYGTGKRREWQDEDIRSCSMKFGSTGDRYIICHAGGKNGFVPNASLFFRTSAKPKDYDDYHGDMNWELFLNWLDKKLLPNLHEPSAIVVDNASYHSKLSEYQPSTKWTKPELQSWLDSQHIDYEVTSLKRELLLICKAHKRPAQYALDEYVKTKSTHEIVRLPPYHCQYNPIEMVWSLTKRYFDAHVGRNNDFSLENTDKIWAEALASVTPEFWMNCCRHTERLILEDYAREVGNDMEQSYEIRITCDNEDSIDEEDFEMMEFRVEGDPNDSERMDVGVTVISNTTCTSSQSPLVNNERSVCRSLFDCSMDVDGSQGSGDVMNQDGSDDVIDLPSKVFNASNVVTATLPITSFPASITNEETDAAVFSILHLGSNEECADIPIIIIPDDTEAMSVESDRNISPEQLPVLHAQDWLTKSLETIIPTDGEAMRVGHLATLAPGGWLNDVIINKYLNLVVKRSQGSVYAFDTFFFNKLRISYNDVKEWTKKVDIFSKELLLIPINLRLHWRLCVVQVKEKRIEYYDSLGTVDQSIMNTILQYLIKEHDEKKRQPLMYTEWTTRHATDIPHQNNSSDCGVFVCTYAEHLARCALLNFTAEDMPQIRERMMEELISSVLTCSLSESSPSLLPNRTNDGPEWPIISNERTWMVTDKKKLGEIAIPGIDRVLLYQSARFHQGDKRFPPDRRNSQCTAICTVGIVALHISDADINQNLLDQILTEGDKYYVDCKSRNNISYNHLSPEDLLTSFTTCGQEVNIDVHHCGEGLFSSGNGLKEIEACINSNALTHEANLARIGFLFTDGSKTFAFFISPRVPGSTRRNFFMFNPHSVNNRNYYPLDKPSQGKARLFRCLSAEALAGLLLTGHRSRTSGGWQIYRVEVNKTLKG
ncbi:uncharacterized protein [Fopius arisanus]|nr:PREDICTED: uncharacterized protein LOC105270870 isoform X2 [Fopius arisanus]